MAKQQTKNVEGSAFAEKGGKQVVQEVEPVGEVTSSGPMANVNVTLGHRRGLPNYSDVRIGVSLTVPCEADEEAIEGAFEFALEWCRNKMDVVAQAVGLGEGE